MGEAVKIVHQGLNGGHVVAGPSIFETEFLRQLQEELSIFLKGSNCTTLTDIVIGVRGQNYQTVIPMNRRERYASV